MREIKFRAIIPERNAKIYFTLQDLLKNKFSNREILWKWLKEGNQPDLYTGLKDKNGREIYEGDIVKQKYLVGWSRKKGYIYNQKIGIVKFKNGMFSAGFEIELKKAEIVGNIYETLELVEEGR